MKIRAILTIDIEADDFVAAVEHQRRMEALVREMKVLYPTATLVFRERRLSAREAAAGNAMIRSASPQATGRLSAYVD